MSGDIVKPQGYDDYNDIRLFLAGDEGGFDSLVRRHKDRVYRACFRFLGNHADADDCAQEVFVKVYGSLQGFRFQSSFSTWLYRIVMNSCKNRISSLHYRLRRNMINIDQEKDDGDGVIKFDIPDSTFCPRAAMSKKEMLARIEEAIACLPCEKRQIVVLRDIEDLSYQQIADVLCCRIGTVKSKLARAREDLKAVLREMM